MACHRIRSIPRILQRFLLLFFFWLSSTCASADGALNNVLILLSDNDDVYLDVATTITNTTIKYCRNHELTCQNSNFDIVQISSYESQPRRDHQLIITLGIQAALFTQKHYAETPTISALVPKNSKAIENSSYNNPQQYYLYLDHPIERSLLLIKALSERFKNIGVLVAEQDQLEKSRLKDLAKFLDLNLHMGEVASTESIGTALSRILDDIDIFLALPDSNIHNKTTVSYILLSTYRKRIPLIGFSSAYVKAGALAAVYSSPQDIADQVRDNVVDYFKDKRLPKFQQMDAYFSVLFNTDVARSLGFPIKSETRLKKTMMELAPK
ncbi:MAG: ABC transporter substrate binding protein [Candidatus Thiodiazotropha sp.]